MVGLRALLLTLIAMPSVAWTQTVATPPAQPPAQLASQNQAPPPAPPPCTSDEHRQFDFWLGDWKVSRPDGKPAGRSRIESILDGCAVLENWTGASGFAGKSFNLYNRATGRWEQFWVSHGGRRLYLVGGLEGDAMVLKGEREKPDPETGKRPRERVTWNRQPDGAVRQRWETSTDGGVTWQVTFDGLYRRMDGN